MTTLRTRPRWSGRARRGGGRLAVIALVLVLIVVLAHVVTGAALTVLAAGLVAGLIAGFLVGRSAAGPARRRRRRP